MLKNKVIGTFVAIWFAVCLSYGGLRATLVAVLEESVASAQEATASWEDADTTSQPVVVVEREATEEVAEASLEEPEGEATETLVEEPVDEVTVAPEEEPAEEPATEESLEEESSWYEEEESLEEEESWEAEAEEIFVPSLEEYLNQYTCGSCRRNCSLANPRCFNGSQLADAKAQEYYSLFY
jgi:hypothetical protein